MLAKDDADIEREYEQLRALRAAEVGEAAAHEVALQNDAQWRARYESQQGAFIVCGVWAALATVAAVALWWSGRG